MDNPKDVVDAKEPEAKGPSDSEKEEVPSSQERRQRRKRADTPPSEDSSETPTADEEEQGAGSLKSVKQYGVAADRNARFRRTMEDAHHAADEICGPGTAYFGIYDGHGGRGAVNFVAEHLHVNFQEQIEMGDPVEEAWKQAYLKTDADMAKTEVGYSGSTVATAYICTDGGPDNNERWLYCANCGDARAVLCRAEGKALRLTKDHKGTDPEEVKRIQDAGGLVVLNRVSGVLAVTRSLGDLKMKEYVIGEPYCQSVKLEDTDTWLVVACDGLWDVCSDQEVCDVLTESEKPEDGSDPLTAQQLANRLLIKSIKAGTTDNVSIIVVKL